MKLKHYALSSGAIIALGTLALAPSAYADDDLPVGAAPHDGDELIIDVDNETTTWVNDELNVSPQPADPPAASDQGANSDPGTGGAPANSGTGADDAGDAGSGAPATHSDGAGDSGAYDVPSGQGDGTGDAGSGAPATHSDGAGDSGAYDVPPAHIKPEASTPSPSSPAPGAATPGPQNDAASPPGDSASNNAVGNGTSTPDADGHSVGIDDVDAAPGYEGHEVSTDDGTPGGKVLEPYVPSDHPCTTANCDPKHFEPTEDHSVDIAQPDPASPSETPAPPVVDNDEHEIILDDGTTEGTVLEPYVPSDHPCTTANCDPKHFEPTEDHSVDIELTETPDVPPAKEENSPAPDAPTVDTPAGKAPENNGDTNTGTPADNGTSGTTAPETGTDSGASQAADAVISRKGDSVTIELDIFDLSTLPGQDSATNDTDQNTDQNTGNGADQDTDQNTEQGAGQASEDKDQESESHTGSGTEADSDNQDATGGTTTGGDSESTQVTEPTVTTAVGASVVFEGESYDLSKLMIGGGKKTETIKTETPSQQPTMSETTGQSSASSQHAGLAQTGSEAGGTLSLAGLLASAGAALAMLRRRR